MRKATSGSEVQMIQLYCNGKRARRLGWGDSEGDRDGA